MGAVSCLVCLLLLINIASTVSVGTDQIRDYLGEKYLDLINSPQISVTSSGTGRVVAKVAEDYELPVLELFKIAVPTFARSLTSVQFFEDASSNPLNFHVDQFVIDIGKKAFTLSTRESDEDIDVIPDFLELRAKAEITVTIDTSPGVQLVNRLSLTALNLAGTWQVGVIEIDFQLTKQGDVYTLTGAPSSGTIPVKEFIKLLGQSYVTESFGGLLKNAGFDQLSLQQVKAVVRYQAEKGYAVALSGRPTITGWGGFTMHVIFHQYEGDNGNEGVVTLAIELDRLKVSDVIARIIGVNISAVPVLGSVTSPKTGLVISTGQVHQNLLPGLIGSDSILNHAQPFPKGVSLVAQIALKQDVAPVVFLIRLTENSVTFEKIDKSGSLTLGLVIGSLIPGLQPSSLRLPPGVSNVLGMSITDLDYYHQSRQLAVTVELADTLVLIPNLLSIDSPKLSINSTLTRPGDTQIQGSGLWSVGPASFPLYIHPVTNNGQKGFLIKGEGKQLRVGDILSEFNARFLPDPLANLLDRAGLKDFLIRNPKVQVPIGAGAQGQQLLLSGEPVIGGFSGVTVNVAAVKQSDKVTVAVGFDFADTNFAGLVKKITGKTIKGLSMLDKSLKIGVIVSRETLTGVKFQGPTLSALEVQKGVTIAALFEFPDDCGSDKVCDFCKSALGSDASMRLRAVIESPSQFMVAAGVANIKLGSSLVLNSVELQLEVGEETSFGFAGSLKLNNPPLTFNGAIRFAPPTELQLEMSMIGIWKRAFGINFLAVGNLQLEIGVVLAYPPVLSLLKFGGEVRVGKLDSGKELIAKAYVGLDINTPKNNYFYGSIASASISRILQAFGMRVVLPKVLAQSGFPTGLSASYSIKEVTVPGLTIPAGVRLAGTINILGFTAYANIKLNLPKSLLVEIRLSKLSLSSALQVCASRSDCSTGPIVYARMNAGPPASVTVTIQGYATVFNLIHREIIIHVENDRFIFSLRDRLFLFDATMTVSARYGSLKSASFRVSAVLSGGGLTNLKRKVTDIIKNAADIATEKIAKAQRKVDSAQGAYDNAIRVLEDKKRSVDRANGAYDRAVTSLREKQRNVNNLCSKKSCSRNCVGCPKWNGCCKKVWGKCIGCPGWNGCCTRITDPICAAKNLACEALRKTAYAALWAAEKVVDKNRWPLNVAKAALTAAQTIVDKNRWPLTAAKNFLEGIKKGVQFAAGAASAIVRFTLGGLIGIRKITFDVEIGVVQLGRFQGSLEVSFLNGPYKTLSFDLRFKSIIDMAKDLADTIFPGITGRSRRDVDEQLSRALPDFSRKHYFPQESIYRPGTARRAAPLVAVKTSAEWLREFAKRSPGELGDIDIPDEEEEEGPDPLDEIELEEEVPLADDAREAEDEAEKLKHAGEEEPDLPSDDDDDGEGEMNEDEMELEEIQKTPEATDEKCSHFRKLIHILDVLIDGFEIISNSWRSAANAYSKAKNSMSVGMDTIQAVKSATNRTRAEVHKMVRGLAQGNGNAVPTRSDMMAIKVNLTQEEQETRALDKLLDGVSAWKKRARDRIVRQNMEGLRKTVITLDHSVRQKTGMGLTTYVSKLFESLAEPYRQAEFEDYEARDEILANEDLRSVIDSFTEVLASDRESTVNNKASTLYSLLAQVQKIREDLAKMKQHEVFCSQE